MSKTINATAADFEKEVLQSEVPVLVDFWAEWCGPCRMMTPVLDELSEETEGKLKVVKVDVEDPANLALAQKYQILSIPNMKVFRGGEVTKDIVGVRPKEALLQEIGEL
jgi:thioredoxin 1